jgi:hypothetical protein
MEQLQFQFNLGQQRASAPDAQIKCAMLLSSDTHARRRHVTLVNKWTPLTEANAGRRQGKKVKRLSFIHQTEQEKGPLLLTNYSCRRVRQPLIISQRQGTRTKQKKTMTDMKE